MNAVSGLLSLPLPGTMVVQLRMAVSCLKIVIVIGRTDAVGLGTTAKVSFLESTLILPISTRHVTVPKNRIQLYASEVGIQ